MTYCLVCKYQWSKFIVFCLLGRLPLSPEFFEPTGWHILMYFPDSKIQKITNFLFFPSSLSPCSRRIWWRNSLYSEWSDVLKQRHLETCPLPDLCLWQWSHSLWQDTVPGCTWMCWPCNSSWRMLSRLPTYNWRWQYQFW